MKISDRFEIKGRGTVICWNLKDNNLPQNCTADSFNGLEIQIDGLKYIISGAEPFRPSTNEGWENLNWAAIITLA